MPRANSVTNCWPYVSDLLMETYHNYHSNSRFSRVEGSLLFADLSGFTSLSEKLATMGRKGAEKLAGLLNDCFTPLLEIVFFNGGDIIKFGGDSFLVLFCGDNHIERAFETGQLLISWVNDNGRFDTPVGTFVLGIHAGISSGEVFSLILGNPGERREHLFCGATVEDAYAAADLAKVGELAMTKTAIDRLNYGHVAMIDERFGLTCLNKSPVKFEHAQRKMPIGLRDADAGLADFMITGLGELIAESGGIVEGEHRVLTSLFIGVESLRRNLEVDFEKSVKAINEYFVCLNRILERYEGALARIDNTASGEKILAFFGAPKSSGCDAANALKAALRLEKVMAKINESFPIPVRCRYGINTGVCFVGDIGTNARREYTAMGDAINLAARLMGRAQYGQILAGENTIRLAGKGFVWESEMMLQVKGKAEPIAAYPVLQYKQELILDKEIIGRQSELEKGIEFLRSAESKLSKILAISGEPGIGKSTLCSKIISKAKQIGMNVATGACFKNSEKTPYEPFIMALYDLLGLTSRSGIRERHHVLTTRLSKLGESEWSPLLARLLGYEMPVPPDLANLPENIKQEKIQHLLGRLISDLNKDNKVLIFIDDIQWIDTASFEILKTLITIEKPPLMLFAARQGEVFDKIKGWPNTTVIELGNMEFEDAKRLFLERLGNQSIHESIVKNIVERSGGNPFYLEEMAHAFLELGPDKLISGDDIPSSIEAVITARIDNLAEPVKRTLRSASVIGRVFALKVLKAIHPDKKKSSQLDQHLWELRNLDLTPLERSHPVIEYIFKHILTQEVAYNGLAYASRENLHLKIAEYYTKNPKKKLRNPELPARHYLLANRPTEALPFLCLAAEKAASGFATAEAIDFYNRAMDISEKTGDRRFVVEILRKRAILQKQSGNYEQAIADLKLLKRETSDEKIIFEIYQELTEIYRSMADYEAAQRTLDEFESTFPENLHVKAFCLDSLGTIERRRGDLRQSLILHRSAQNIAFHCELSLSLLASIHNNIGICLWTLGNLNEARDHYKKALNIYRRTRDLNGQAKVMNNLGIINEKNGKLKQAATAYSRAEKIFGRIGMARSQALACANLGTNLTTRGYLGEAVAKLNEALKIFQRIGDQHCIALCHGDLGYTCYCMGRLNDAFSHLEKSIKLAESLGEMDLVIENKIRLSRINAFVGVSQLAGTETLIAEAKEMGAKELEFNALILQAWKAIFENNFPRSIESIGSAESIGGDLGTFETKLELIALKAIEAWLSRDEKTTIRLLNRGIVRAYGKDLAINVFDLWLIASSCGIVEKLNEDARGKVIKIHRRIENAIDEASIPLFRSQTKRRLEFLKSTISRTLLKPAKDQLLLAKSNT